MKLTYTTAALAAAAMMVVSPATAQVVIVDDSFANGITDGGTGQEIGFATTSSGAGLDADQPAGPLDFASGGSGRSIHGLFAAQTLAEFGESLNVTFSFTTPDTVAFDNNAVSTNEDFRFGLFDSSTATGNDADTGAAFDFTNNITVSSGTPQPGLDTVAGFNGEIDNINAPGSDLGIRTHNVNNLAGVGNLSEGEFLNSNDGFDFITGGTDDLINVTPNTDFIGSLSVAFTDETLTSLDITVGIADSAGAIIDSLTTSVAIDDTEDQVGVNTTTFDLLTFHATSGAFGGNDGPIAGSSNTGEANNGIDISNVSVTFTPVPEPASLTLLAAGAGLLATRRRKSA